MKRTVAAILLLALCASLFACTAKSPVYASLGKYEITESMYEYWLSYYKSRFYASLSEYGLITGDYDESAWQLSPDGERTLGEQVKDHVDEQIRQMLVCSVLYDEKGYGDDAETKALLSDLPLATTWPQGSPLACICRTAAKATSSIRWHP